MNYPTIVYNTAHNQGRNHKHLASRSAEEVLKMKRDRTLCLYGEWFSLLAVISILVSGKLSSCRGKSGSQKKVKSYSLCPQQSSVLWTQACLWRFALMPHSTALLCLLPAMCLTSTHCCTPDGSAASGSQRLPALTQKLNVTLPGCSREAPQTSPM